MKLPMYQLSSFTRHTFAGNPAAVVVTEEDLDHTLMQQIAAQNNLSETAFVTLGKSPLPLRWFTPTVEIDLCGHATLAAAHVLWHHGYCSDDVLRFMSLSGELSVNRVGELLQLNFPARPAELCNEITFTEIAQALGCDQEDIEACLMAKTLLVALRNQAALEKLAPVMDKVRLLHPSAVMVTAPGEDVDFVARFFAPNVGIDEDPVTGSAYTTLAPYWAERLGKTHLKARQLSARGGEVVCDLVGERVLIGGYVQDYLSGEITV